MNLSNNRVIMACDLYCCCVRDWLSPCSDSRYVTLAPNVGRRVAIKAIWLPVLVGWETGVGTKIIKVMKF